ncbi:hypothetical protein [Absidia glauca]|uniref:Uncharacterized protein n=1 Tax=Absidia glauca TaxID=4829 RepID=A0A168NFG5_ABSGL|nr:hypothetical protein [Absidia glauca]
MFLNHNVKLLLPRSAQSLIRRSSLPSLIIHRSFTSSRLHFKAHDGGTSTGSNCSRSGVDDEEKLNTTATDGQEPFVSASPEPTSLPFMPVIHIPQTEFAHNAFFSLHRPLLGLEDDKMDKPFFSNQAPEEALVDVNEQISNYLMTLRPFEVPAPPQTQKQTQSDSTTTATSSWNTHLHTQKQQEEEEEEDYYMDHSLPVFYMPESDDIVDYLTTMQTRLVRQNAFYDAISVSAFRTPGTTGRTKGRSLASSMGLEKSGSKPSPTSKLATSPFTSTIVSSRFQKRLRQGIYRHRWSK